MAPYEVFIHMDLLESAPKRGVQRDRIMKFISRLGDDPYTPGDFTDKDASLRVRNVKIVGDHAITYWVDGPAKAVMVVELRPADK